MLSVYEEVVELHLVVQLGCEKERHGKRKSAEISSRETSEASRDRREELNLANQQSLR